MILTKQQILSADDLKRETVKVKEWGGEVIVRALSGIERDAFEQSLVRDGKTELTNVRAKLVARCCVDEAGNRLFEDHEIEALGLKSSRALERISKVAQRLNGMGDKELEDIQGN